MTEGQIEDWDNFVETHATRVFRVALRILGSVQDAEDVSQEVFFEAFQVRINGSVRNWDGFLVRITTLRSIDRYRKTRPSVTISEQDAISSVQPIDLLIEDEQKRTLRHEVSQLPDQQATVFVMFYFEHMTREEISTELGISVDSVSSSLFKAKKQLASKLATVARGGTE